MIRYIIIRSKTLILPTNTTITEWKKVRCERRNGKLYWSITAVTRSQAEDFIKEQGMADVFSTKDGTIYDTPSQGFKDLQVSKMESRHLIDNPW